ncbi:synaptonemal complex central element protein 2 [Vanacampus margaritifer]
MDFCFEEAPASHSTQTEGCDEDKQMAEYQVEDTEASFSMNDVEDNSSSNDITRRAQELVEKIHNRRTSDEKEIESFQHSMMDKVTEVCQQMKQDLYKVYEENNGEMQVKLMELNNVLDTCTKLHSELLEASQVLASLRDNLPSVAISGTDEHVTD